MSRLDPRSPTVFGTVELGRRPGSMVETQRTLTLPEPTGTEVLAVPAGAPIEVEVRMESVMEGILVTGSVRATAEGACVRCLEPLTVAIDAPFQELFVYPERAAHSRKTGAMDEDTSEYEVIDDHIDLGPVVVDAVVPTLPFQPVCRPDCPGLCSECGFRMADDPDHAHELLDPRWSALASLATSDGSESPQEKRN